MIIARAPVRVSFVGGGTDMAPFYEAYGGRVVSATINRYVYAILTPNGLPTVQITSSDLNAFLRIAGEDERPIDVEDGSLALPRAVLREFGLHAGVDLFIASETPPGTGLGSSSATTVALVKALAIYEGRELGPAEVADMACRIEIDRLGAPIGKQDQYAATFGGVNAIEFRRDGTVSVSRVPLSDEAFAKLEQRVQLYFTGAQRDANAILERQQDAIEGSSNGVVESLNAMLGLADRAERALAEGDVDELGLLIREGWERKRALVPGISSDQFDEWIELALANGALGAKLTGAGGGGYVLALAEAGREEELRTAMESAGLSSLDFRFDLTGARVLVNSEPYTGAAPA